MRYLTTICFTLTATLLFAGTVRADDTLTLELPPSQSALDARAAAKAQAEAQAAAANAARKRVHVRTETQSGALRSRLPSRGQTSSERVVGRLGEITQRAAIYRGPSSGSGRMTSVDAGTYIAIKDDSGRWYGVLMADGSTGWIAAQNVNLLDYQVVSNGAPTLPNFGNPGRTQPRTGSEFFTGDPQALLNEAYKYMGVPYQWGGNTVAGIDCSGFMKKIFGALGFNLPRTAAEQTGLGIPVSPDQLQAGDRLYFGKNGRITHTGLYIGNDYFIHSSASRHGVAISRLSETTYQRIFVCARR